MEHNNYSVVRCLKWHIRHRKKMLEKVMQTRVNRTHEAQRKLLETMYRLAVVERAPYEQYEAESIKVRSFVENA